MQNHGTHRTQVIELPVSPQAGGTPNNQVKFKFGQQANLWGMVTTKVEVYTNTDVPQAPSGNPTASYGQISQATLMLYMNNPDNPKGDMGQFIQMPLPSLHYLNNLVEPFVWMPNYFDPGAVIQWEKSTIELPVGLGVATTFSYLLNIYYREPYPEEIHARKSGKRLRPGYHHGQVQGIEEVD